MLVEEIAQEKVMKENLIFSIDLATITMIAEDTKSTEDEPKAFNKA